MLRVSELRGRCFGPVSFEVAAGECLVVQGRSGSGKTLLLRAVADLDPSVGDVRLGDLLREEIPGPHWRKRAAYVGAVPGWWAHTVGEHFVDWSSAAAAIESLGLPSDCHGWPVARLSTGEQQRLALVRALEGGPGALLLDEPTSALDPDATAWVEDLVAGCLRGGMCAVWVTHDEPQAQRVGHCRLVLAQQAGPR